VQRLYVPLRKGGMRDYFMYVFGYGFTVDYAMNYASPTLHHNELKGFTAAAMSGVCHDVAIEPVLQP